MQILILRQTHIKRSWPFLHALDMYNLLFVQDDLSPKDKRNIWFLTFAACNPPLLTALGSPIINNFIKHILEVKRNLKQWIQSCPTRLSLIILIWLVTRGPRASWCHAAMSIFDEAKWVCYMTIWESGWYLLASKP